MDDFVRMRLGIIFELFATNNVEDALKTALGWDDIISSLDNGINVIDVVIAFIRYNVIPYISLLFATNPLFHDFLKGYPKSLEELLPPNGFKTSSR